MPNELITKGAAALKKVKDQVKTKEGLQALIEAAVPGGSIESCNATAEILGDIISSKPLKVVSGFEGKPPADRVDIVAGLLETPKMVYLNIIPDHHFIVFPIDTDKVVILQGFQGVYSLLDWMKARGTGVIRKDEFLAAMRDMATGSAGEKTAAAVKLFGYNLAFEGKALSPEAKRVQDEIIDYYKGKTINMKVCASKEL